MGAKIFYLIIIVLIIGVAFLGQQPFARSYGKELFSGLFKQENIHWGKASAWISGLFGETRLRPNQDFGEAKTGDLAGGEEPIKTLGEEINIFENSFLKK